MEISPARVPPRLIMTRRRARPMVALARKPGPKTPAAQLMPMLRRTGPFTMMRGEVALVVPDWPCKLNRESHAASTTASSTGKYSGRHPAITAFTASFSTVARPKLGGTSATSVWRERDVVCSMRSTRSRVGGTTGSPSVTPRSNQISISSAMAAPSIRMPTIDLACYYPRLSPSRRPHHEDATHQRRRARHHAEHGRAGRARPAGTDDQDRDHAVVHLPPALRRGAARLLQGRGPHRPVRGLRGRRRGDHGHGRRLD